MTLREFPMKFSLVFLLLFFTQVGFADDLENTTWLITKKTCDSREVRVTQNERIHIQANNLAYIYRISENANQYCNQAIAYGRITQSAPSSGEYSDSSTLVPQAIRTACMSKQTDAIVSDSTRDTQGPSQVLDSAVHGDTGFADWQGVRFCPNGVAHIELKKK